MPELWNRVTAEISPLELLAAVTSLVCVYLTVKNNIWNWFWGLIGSVLYGYIFFRVSHLYANAGLQLLYFVPMQFVGYYVWLKGNAAKDDALPVTALTVAERFRWSATVAGLSVALFYGLPPVIAAFALPAQQLSALDCFTTGLSIAAQFLQTYKKFENWILWIVADLVYTFYVFPQLKMPITTLLYAVFTILAITGAIDWYQLMRKTQTAQVTGED
ncbi:MAG: nicotinamide mononucleotide transporter [Armatimonadetes bacterium]|nr:nicotinamide mononucleotide transporter [Armatimonadota bacterium]